MSTFVKGDEWEEDMDLNEQHLPVNFPHFQLNLETVISKYVYQFWKELKNKRWKMY